MTHSGRNILCACMHLNLCHFPTNTFHTPEFLGQDAGIMELDVVTQLSAMVNFSG
jgi:hypothetical protein